MTPDGSVDAAKLYDAALAEMQPVTDAALVDVVDTSDALMDGAGDANVVDAASCSVTSQANLGGGGSCNAYYFPFSGSPMACGADDGGSLSPSECQALCPPSPLGGVQALSCNIVPWDTGPNEPTWALGDVPLAVEFGWRCTWDYAALLEPSTDLGSSWAS